MPDPVIPPPDPKQAAEDALVAMISRAAERSASTAADAAVKAAMSALPPPPPPDPNVRRMVTELDTTEAEEEFQSAIAAGDGKKALKMLKDKAINPGASMIQFAIENMGKNNVKSIEQQFGEKFTKRKPLFESLMRKYGRSYADLADPSLADTLWKLTTAEDPTFMEEEVNARLAKANSERETEAARIANLPPAVAPITDFIKIDEPHIKLAERYMPKDAAGRENILRACYRYGVTLEGVLRQVAKYDDHPEEIESSGKGTPWVELGGSSRPPVKQKSA